MAGLSRRLEATKSVIRLTEQIQQGFAREDGAGEAVAAEACVKGNAKRMEVRGAGTNSASVKRFG